MEPSIATETALCKTLPSFILASFVVRVAEVVGGMLVEEEREGDGLVYVDPSDGEVA